MIPMDSMIAGWHVTPEGGGGPVAGVTEIVPQPPPWMLRDAAPATAAARQVGAAADEVERVAARLGGLLLDTAASLGWRGTAADAAAARSEHNSSQLRQASSALRSAEQALDDLARMLDTQGADLRSLHREAGDLWDRLNSRPLAVAEANPGTTSPIDRLLAMRTEIEHRIDALAVADARVADALHRAASELSALASLVAEDGWVGTAASPGVLALLARYGLVDDVAEQRILDRAVCLPATGQATEQLRSWLAQLPPEQARAFLERHPDLARRLTGPLPAAADLTPGTAAAQLAAVLSASAALPAEQRIARVRAFFAGLTPTDAARLATLYPGAVGNLDGAPLPERIAANRLKIAVALADERARHADLVLAVDGQDGVVRELRAPLSNGTVSGLAYDADTPEKTLAASTSRIAFYERLLHEEPPNPGQVDGATSRPARTGHQILFFDPAGDGTMAELWGQVDEHTRHVGLFVPGTTSAVDGGSFERYSGLMREMAAMDGSGRTATIAWLGSDMPDAIAWDAPKPGYAEDAGPRLRDFVWGLDVPATADSTVIGHSYGGAVVGVADRHGLEVNRVLHVESAGAGRDVWSLADYRADGRNVQHYSMTAPGDLIENARTPQWLQDRSGLGHGGNPDTMPGFVRLETGRFDDGPDSASRGGLIEGVGSHTTVLTPRSTAWNNMFAVIQGGRVVPYQPPIVTILPVAPGTAAPPPILVQQPYSSPLYTPATLLDIP